MSGFFQRLFGKDNKPAIARGPLGLHLNSGFTLDTLAFRLLEDELLIALPGEEFTVAAVSHIDLGGGSQIFRYYTSGDEFLQINTTGGEDIDDIDDIKLFDYEESYGISKESHWREAINAKAMGAMTLNWQEKRWQRFFNSEEPGNIEPVYMLEKVENQNHAKWEVHNFTMGYQRQVTEDTYEYLLLNGEESFNDLGEPEWLFSRALGVDIPAFPSFPCQSTNRVFAHLAISENRSDRSIAAWSSPETARVTSVTTMAWRQRSWLSDITTLPQPAHVT
jgi:hypothetical protein